MVIYRPSVLVIHETKFMCELVNPRHKINAGNVGFLARNDIGTIVLHQ